ncbi:MAG: hypothetical protein AB7M05_12305 [Alphaproteobacteria bacterium]
MLDWLSGNIHELLNSIGVTVAIWLGIMNYWHERSREQPSADFQWNWDRPDGTVVSAIVTIHNPTRSVIHVRGFRLRSPWPWWGTPTFSLSTREALDRAPLLPLRRETSTNVEISPGGSLNVAFLILWHSPDKQETNFKVDVLLALMSPKVKKTGITIARTMPKPPVS